MTRRSRWTAAAIVMVVVAGCLIGWRVLGDDPEPTRSAPRVDAPPTATATVPGADVEPVSDPCAGAAPRPFTPERISVDGVVEDAAVIGVPRDGRDVPGVLPVSDKVDFAWDLGGIRPGSRRGNVLLNTHTWPDGSALGNAMLTETGKGDRIVLTGRHGARVCYRISRQVEVLAADGYPPYYDTDGPPRVAILVCSGTRSGAGEWSHRTIWFARPVSQ